VADRSPLIQILRRPPEPAASPSPRPAVVERLRRDGITRARRVAAEQCEFCGVEIAPEHGHLVDLPQRALLCVCRPCYLLFTHEGAGGARFRAVPDRYALISGFAQAEESWNALDLPIGLAFFFRNSATGRTTAFYPSPAGATESELPLDAWDGLVRAVPVLSTLQPDVEALLVRRAAGVVGPDGSAEAEIVALIVPIDVCYELVGVIRVAWQGFQGGENLWRNVDMFFARAIERATRGRA
jgi:hypothetical protein